MGFGPKARGDRGTGRRWLRWLALAGVASLAAGIAAAGLLVAAALAVPLPARLSSGRSVVVEFRDGSPAHVFLSPDEKWRIPARLSELDPAYLDALVALEDERFRLHPGVDPISIGRAALENARAGKVVSGASTITMQLAKLLEPRPRTLGAKLVEAFRAVQLELWLSKDELLAAYLTFLPFGRNLEGVEAASLAYFGHGARHLSAAEIATLLAVPQDPSDRHPTPANAARLAAARDEVAAKLLRKDRLPLGPAGARVTPEELLAQVKATPVPAQMQRFPRLAPHAAGWLKDRAAADGRVVTTLDRGVQQVSERLLKAAGEGAARKGAHNGALVVVDHGAAEIRALVGNFDFWDAEHAGQIAGFAQPRSPGSTLKPFLYALAIDRGLVLPEQLVADVPTRYGGYAPKNYDGSYSGLVRLEDALSLSLNLPFIELLSDVGVDRFIGALRAMDVQGLHDDPGHYGLTAAVGGLELSPLALAGLYATLAEGGRHRPLRVLESDPRSADVQAFSSGSAYLTMRALSRKDRPDFPARARMGALPRGIHWKTGTSFGHRDAWSAGSGPTYTAVVWMGNFDQRPAPELAGSEATGPLLFDVLEALEDPQAPPLAAAVQVPHDLREVHVCAFSGHPATPACPERRAVLARTASVPTRPCPYHVNVEVDTASGLALNPSCRGGREWERRSYVVLPSRVRRYLQDRDQRVPSPPRLAPGCETATARASVRIASPPPGQAAVLIAGMPADRQEIPLEVEAEAAREVSWFVNGEYLGTVPAEDRLWWTPREGAHELVAVADGGPSAKRTLVVRRQP